MNKFITISIAILLSACDTTRTSLEPKVENTQRVTYLSFCDDLVEHLNESRVEFIQENFDIETLVRNLFVGIDLKPEIEKLLYTQMKQILTNNNFKSIQTSLKTREQWYKINTSNDRRCVIHSELAEDGLYMLDFLMSDTSGMPKFIDWHNYTFNFKLSSSMRELLSDLLPGNKDKISSLAFSRISLFLAALKSNEVEKTLSAFNALPNELQGNPVYLQLLLSLIPSTHKKYFELMARLELVVDDNDKGLIFYE